MRNKARNDLRVAKTLDGIQTGFRKLAQEMPYAGLTVSELCAQARISRNTFYAYFTSLDELLEHVLEKLTREYIDRIKHYHVPDDIGAITREFYLFSVEQGKFYDNLIRSENCQAIGSRLLMRFVRETWKSFPWFSALRKEERDLPLRFIHNTGASLYRQWVLDGKKIPLEDMIEYADVLLASGIEGFKRIENNGL